MPDSKDAVEATDEHRRAQIRSNCGTKRSHPTLETGLFEKSVSICVNLWLPILLNIQLADLESALDFQAGKKSFQAIQRRLFLGRRVQQVAQVLDRAGNALDRSRQRRSAGVGVAAALQ